MEEMSGITTKVDSVWSDVVGDKVEFTWKGSQSNERYLVTVEGEGVATEDRLEAICEENLCSFLLEKFRIGFTVNVAVSVIEDDDTRLIHSATDCLIGSLFVVRNLSAELNPSKGDREIKVAFDKPDMPGVSAYVIQAVRVSEVITRDEVTEATKFTIKYLKSNTKYIIKVKPIFQDEGTEIPYCSSLPITTQLKTTGSSSMMKFVGVKNTTINLSHSKFNDTNRSNEESPVNSKVRNLVLFAMSGDTPNRIKAEWDLPDFSQRLNDFRIRYFLVEIFVVDGVKLPSLTVHYEEERISFATEVIDLSPGKKYRIVVKTVYDDIDNDRTYKSDGMEAEKDLAEVASREGNSFQESDKDNRDFPILAMPEVDMQDGQREPIPEPIRKVARWTKDRKLDENIFGKTHRVTDLTGAMERARLILTQDNLSQKEKETLRNDLKIIQSLRHERLIQHLGFEEINGEFHIFTEICLWKKLGSFLRHNGAMDEHVASKVTYQIVDAVSYLHESGLVHGSIRSENILLSDEHKIKISQCIPGKKVETALLSSSHSAIASTSFMTPEEARGPSDMSVLTPELDTWGIGCTVVEMLTSRKPYAGIERIKIRELIKGLQMPKVPQNVSEHAKNFLRSIFVKHELRPSPAQLMGHEWLLGGSSGGVKPDSMVREGAGTGYEARVNTNPQECNDRNLYKHEDFQLVGDLGSGMFGTVYKAMYKKSKKQYAVKKFRDCADPYVKREIDLSATLQHENLVRCYGYYRKKKETRERLFLVMELMDKSLKKEVEEKNGLSEGTAREYTRKILAGLLYLHLNGIVHRDIKASNILIRGTDCVKIADYGSLRKTSKTEVYAITGITGRHGTEYWMSPEMYQEKGFTKNTDIWSLGCTVVEMISITPPLYGVEGYRDRLGMDRPDIPIFPGRDDVSPELRQFLKTIFVPKEERPYAHHLVAGNPWF